MRLVNTVTKDNIMTLENVLYNYGIDIKLIFKFQRQLAITANYIQNELLDNAWDSYQEIQQTLNTFAEIDYRAYDIAALVVEPLHATLLELTPM